MLQRLRRREDDGFTLVETVVALALFGLLVATVATSLAALLSHTRNNQNRTVAANIAQRIIDRLHAVEALQLPEGDLPPERYAVDGNEFTVRTNAALVPEGSGSGGSACDTGTGQLSEKRISVVVTWPDMGAARPVRSDTIRQLTVAELDPTKGTATVRIVDRDNVPASGHVVTLQPGGLTYTTGEDGCAVFPRLAPGGYTASLSTPRHVDRTGNPRPARSMGVTANRVTKDPGFVYDEQAGLVVDWVAAGDTPTTYPALAGTGVTLANSDFTGGTLGLLTCPQATTCATPTERGRSVAGLFPAAEGYVAWAGTCSQARPAGSPAAVVLQPSTTGSVRVPLARVTVRVLYDEGRPSGTQTMTFRHSADGGCPTGIQQSVQFSPSTATVKVGLPFGRWSVQTGDGSTSSTLTSAAATTMTIEVGD